MTRSVYAFTCGLRIFITGTELVVDGGLTL